MDSQIIESLPDVELIASKVHDAWWEEKKKQGFHAPVNCPNYPAPAIGKEEAREKAFTQHCTKCHTDMYPYDELPENVKDYDRTTVKAVYKALEEHYADSADIIHNECNKPIEQCSCEGAEVSPIN